MLQDLIERITPRGWAMIIQGALWCLLLSGLMWAASHESVYII